MAEPNIIGRSDLSESMIPVQEVREIIKMTPEKSVMLANARHVTMTSKKYRQPVLNVLPEAYWVNGDTGLKSTTKADWGDLSITAEELAVIVVIPDAVVDDSNIPLWPEVRPLIAEAMGKKVDQACIFGVDKPDSWPASILSKAVEAGNYAIRSTSDLGVTVANLNRKIAEQGYGVNGFLSKPGMQWELVGLRDANGQPIYTQLPNTPAHGLYGYPLNEVMNGSWDSDEAELIALDWTKQLVGIRQDVTYKIFDEGVITDADGKVLFNLMQQDSKALRVVFRVGYQVAKPRTRIQGQTAYPGGVVLPNVILPDLTVKPEDASSSIFGHAVSSLQSGLYVLGGKIKGTLTKVTSGALANDWGEGYFMALSLADNDFSDLESVKIGVDPSVSSGLVELINDEDKNGVFKVTDKDIQSFKVVLSDGVYEKTQEFDLSGLTFSN